MVAYSLSASVHLADSTSTCHSQVTLVPLSVFGNEEHGHHSRPCTHALCTLQRRRHSEKVKTLVGHREQVRTLYMCTSCNIKFYFRRGTGRVPAGVGPGNKI